MAVKKIKREKNEGKKQKSNRKWYLQMAIEVRKKKSYEVISFSLILKSTLEC